MKKTLSAIVGEGYKVLFSNEAHIELDKLLNRESYSSIFILVDSNTKQHCLHLFLNYFSRLKACPVLVIPAGEENKDLETCQELWEQLSQLGADRKSLLINVGGGVVTDLGGFVAAAFKRGIDFINVPTTLLSMVDASVGGKTGVDMGGLKNQIGIIKHPKLVIIDTFYLETLPENEYKSGYAEMLKHGIIQDKDYFEELSQFKSLKDSDLENYIHYSVEIKNNVVSQDLYESNFRKILNFGHTLGHAIETYFLTQPEKKTLLHGEAIAIGMITESYLGAKLCRLNIDTAKKIKKVFLNIFSKVFFTESDIEAILLLLKYDKKNSHRKVKFVLLHEIGEPAIDKEIHSDLLVEAFHFYQKD
ncbi:MAG: 3-dehydroquinate synthase [Pelagibacteraceae bacterium TMED216]|nr:MAG: 3-dehydroquinate synthase [Pelagibacteraceae bacterium TMED216]|tara:strand:+ start:2659 stop:3741 length:1083 start_codon:yes stop_codon:yes gene_type:complete